MRTQPLPKKGRSPQFSLHVYCGQTAAWIKMPLGTEVSLGLRDIVLDEDPAPPPLKGHSPQFRPMCVVTKWLDGLRCHLVWRQASAQATLCSMGTQLPTEKRTPTPTQFLAHVYCGQTAGWVKTPLGTEVDLGPGHIVLNEVQALHEKGIVAPLFSAHVYCGHGRPSQLLLSSCFTRGQGKQAHV